MDTMDMGGSSRAGSSKLSSREVSVMGMGVTMGRGRSGDHSFFSLMITCHPGTGARVTSHSHES